MTDLSITPSAAALRRAWRMSRLGRLVRLVVCPALLSCLAATATAGLIWSETFDDLNYLDGMSSEPCGDKLTNCDCADGVSLVPVASPKRAGSGALMARLTKCHERAELREKTANHPAVGASRYYGFSLRPDTNFDIDRWTIVMQLAQWYSTIPAWANSGAWNYIRIDKGRWVFRCKWSDGSAQNVKTSDTDLGPVTRGVWTDFVIMGNWRAISGGKLHVWIKLPGQTTYTEKVNRVGSVMLDVPKAPYFKIGIYRGDPNWTSPRAVDYIFADQIKVGTAFSDVSLP